MEIVPFFIKNNGRERSMMGKSQIFTPEFLKQLVKTHKSHSKFTDDNLKLKELFKQNINMPTLGTIINVIYKFGYDEDKALIKEFKKKVESGNYDDGDLESIKTIIITYEQQIMSELENKNEPEDDNIDLPKDDS